MAWAFLGHEQGVHACLCALAIDQVLLQAGVFFTLFPPCDYAAYRCGIALRALLFRMQHAAAHACAACPNPEPVPQRQFDLLRTPSTYMLLLLKALHACGAQELDRRLPRIVYGRAPAPSVITPRHHKASCGHMQQPGGPARPANGRALP